ncbi:Putative TEGT family carrier/transport protein [hydrothermal vent metagenome]|uniref:TEGT family carrier/transport protein n=1 Tax=hydrothermal vent metagenome TaxID=652676 RepID=A0A3B0YLT4_9ZZZZ
MTLKEKAVWELSRFITRQSVELRYNLKTPMSIKEDGKDMNRMANTVTHSQPSILATNKVIRNTYILLSMTLLFSAVTAGLSMTLNMPPLGLLPTIIGYFGLLFLTSKFRNSSMGLVFVFALTGFMGVTLGPLINFYLSLPNGDQLVMTALGATGVIFLSLSGYALTSRKDFSFMGAFLMVGILVAFLAGLASVFFTLPGLSLAVSAMFVLLMSGLILYQTSQLVHGGETNYIMATVTLYVSIYNLFTSLLHLLGAFGGDD